MADPTPNEEEAFRPQFGILRMIQGAQKSDNPIMAIVAALFSFLRALIAPEREDAAGDLRGTEDEKRAAIARDDALQQKAKESHTAYADSASKMASPSVVASLPSQLNELRKQSEQANGGKHVEAIMPVASDGRITEGKGHRHAPTKGATTDHQGLDIASDVAGKTPDIISAMPGVVMAAGPKQGYGNTVDVMDIYGNLHRYAHLKDIDVKEGQVLKQGEKLGVMGMTGRATGVHLHYEQRDTGGNAIDPKLMARGWDEGDKFAYKDTQALAQAQSAYTSTVVAQADKPLDAQLAKLDLSSVSARAGYASPAPKTQQAQQRG